MNIIKHPMSDYGRDEHPDERPVFLHTLENEVGMKVSIMERGAAVTRILSPNRDGKYEDVVLGFDDVEDYRVHSDLCLGAMIGRVAGRIGGASFPLDGEDYPVTANEGPNCLHGGMEFNTALWDAEDRITEDTASVILTYVSPEGSNGFPGQVTTKATYTLDNDNALHLHIEAVSDQDTILALTNHTYLNLSGNLRRDVDDHALKADVRQYVEVGKDSVPTGNLVPVDYTPFDFTRGRMLRSGMTSSYPQNEMVGHGYDHALVFSPESGNMIRLYDAESGRIAIIKSDFPSFVLYTGNFLGSGYCFRGVPAHNHIGVAVEMQNLPDAVHHADFPSPILRAGEPYDHEIVWKFLTDRD